MREILFRAKAINRDFGEFRTKYKNGDWVYGLVTKTKNERYPEFSAEMTNTDGVYGIEVDYNTVGQFTGLTDKNGKKIFEGDILQGTITSAWNKRIICCEVVYHRDSFIAFETDIVNNQWVHKLLFAKDIEVIGNIHDNKELLGE